MVAERVRDLAEAVEGQDQQRERPLRPRGLGEGAAEPVLEQHAVRQPGQLVEEPHLAQRLLGQPLLRDVQDEAPHEARLAVGPRQRPPLVAPPQHPPLAVEDPVLRGEAPSRRAGVAELAQHPLPVLRVKPPHPHVRLGEPLPRREARHREQLRAHVGAAAGVVRPRHVGERRDLLDEGAVAVPRVGVGAAAGRARRRPAPLALDGGLEPRDVPPAHAVARARAHETDDLVFGEGLRAHDDGREAPLAGHLDHAARRHAGRVGPGHDELAAGGDPLEVGLAGRQEHRGLEAALLQVRRDVQGGGVRIPDHHDLQRLAHSCPRSPCLGRIRGRRCHWIGIIRPPSSPCEVPEVVPRQVEGPPEARAPSSRCESPAGRG